MFCFYKNKSRNSMCVDRQIDFVKKQTKQGLGNYLKLGDPEFIFFNLLICIFYRFL